MAYCTKCGEEVVEGSTFCQKCRERLPSIRSISQRSPTPSLITKKDYTVFLGENVDKYLPKFKKFNINGTDRFSLTWHWPAFFVPVLWMLYRKLYLWALLALVLNFILGIIPYVGFLLPLVLFGMTGNYIYYKHIKKKILELNQLQVSPDIQRVKLARAGGVNNVAIVIAAIILSIAVVSILAAITIPYFLAGPTRSFNSAAKADLMNATTTQEAYHAEYSTYTNSIEKLTGGVYGLSIREGVTLYVVSASENDYMMEAFHEKGNKKYIINGPRGTIREVSK